MLKPERITGVSSQSETGTIEDVSVTANKGSQRTVKIAFRGNGDTSVAYTYPRGDDADQNTDLDFIGDSASGRLYPIRYLPTRVEPWLKGKRATLRSYGEGEQSRTVLWLQR